MSARPLHAMRKQGAGASAASDMSEEPKPAGKHRQWFTRCLSGSLSLFENKVASLLGTSLVSNLNQQMGFVYFESQLFLTTTRCIHSCQLYWLNWSEFDSWSAGCLVLFLCMQCTCSVHPVFSKYISSKWGVKIRKRVPKNWVRMTRLLFCVEQKAFS